ncbi:hypothetical protein AAT19DRAFT_11433 [Rhodotorula toruloides]|uniref:Uncharacterized protein n=1 Tax=Rhodotorula toruloides TaxID=5286 RepID=A0A2S9ZWR6_RHOTO|nr:hypothetical protein AAT19DRAFT_11433 [Rhodotorula toruloides]
MSLFADPDAVAFPALSPRPHRSHLAVKLVLARPATEHRLVTFHRSRTPRLWTAQLSSQTTRECTRPSTRPTSQPISRCRRRVQPHPTLNSPRTLFAPNSPNGCPAERDSLSRTTCISRPRHRRPSLLSAVSPQPNPACSPTPSQHYFLSTLRPAPPPSPRASTSELPISASVASGARKDASDVPVQVQMDEMEGAAILATEDPLRDGATVKTELERGEGIESSFIDEKVPVGQAVDPHRQTSSRIILTRLAMVDPPHTMVAVPHHRLDLRPCPPLSLPLRPPLLASIRLQRAPRTDFLNRAWRRRRRREG